MATASRDPEQHLNRQHSAKLAMVALGGALAAAAIGFGGAVWGAHVTAKSDDTRAETEFLREQRQAAYAEFYAQVDVWWSELQTSSSAELSAEQMDVVNEGDTEFNAAWGLLQLVSSEEVRQSSQELVLILNRIETYETWRFCEQVEPSSRHCDSPYFPQEQPDKVEDREYFDAIAEFLGEARQDIYPED